jgi:hypothetical protein
MKENIAEWRDQVAANEEWCSERSSDVCFWGKADIGLTPRNVRF